jgi:peptidyl-prolyl cis-trans isomerase C
MKLPHPPLHHALYLFILLLLWAANPALAAERRVALVIGNAIYQGEKTLTNPGNDAADVAALLSRMGFNGGQVKPQLNLGRKAMNAAVQDFMNQAEGADLAVVYYSGHGMQTGGESFLIPTDAQIQNERDVRSDGIRLGELMEDLEGRRIRHTLILLDACRDNPFRTRTKSGTKGLAPPKEMNGAYLVAYATADGKTADDGTGRNGTYTAELLRHLGKSGTNLRDAVEDTQLAVEERSKGQQRPKIYGDSAKFRNVYLAGSPGVQVASIRPEPVQPPIQQSPSNSGKLVNTSTAKQEMLLAYVNDMAVPLARAEALEQQVVRSGKAVTSETKVQIKDEVIAREIFIQEAQKMSLHMTDDFKTQMDLASQTILIRDLFAQFEKSMPAQDKAEKEKKIAEYQQLLRSNAKVTDAAQTSSVAFVNGKAVPQSRVEAFTQQVKRSGREITPEMEKQITDEVIAREIFIQEARKMGLDTTEDFKTQMELARQTILIRELFANYQKSNAVSDVEVRSEYDRFAAANSGKEYRSHHILVDKEDEAKAIIVKLKKGAKFEDIAKKESKDPGSGAKGGDLDWAQSTIYVEEFAQALTQLTKGKTTEAPVKTQFGYHVIRLDDVREAQLPALEAVMSKVTQQLQQQKLAKFQEELRAKAKVVRID